MTHCLGAALGTLEPNSGALTLISIRRFKTLLATSC